MSFKPMVERITAVINSFTKWIEANKGLVASVAVTVGSIAAFGAALFTIGTVSRVLSGGIGALSGVFSAFAARLRSGNISAYACENAPKMSKANRREDSP